MSAASKPFDPMSIKPILLDAALLGDEKEAAKRLKTSKEDPFRWAEVLNSLFRLKESRLDFADGGGTEVKLSGCTRLIEFAVLAEVYEKKGTSANKKKKYLSIPYKRTEESRIPLLKLLVERGANPHPGIEKAKEAGYKKIEAFLEESLIHPDYGWDMLEAKRHFYAEVGKAVKEDIPAAAANVKSPNERRTTRKRSGSKSGSNSNSSKSKSKSNSKSNSKSKTPRGGAGGED
jgi:hypothetical protein